MRLVLIAACFGKARSAVSRLTLTRGLEAEGLEASREGRGVDDVDAVLALAPAIQRDGDDQKHDRHHARSQSRVQGHVAAALHALKRARHKHARTRPHTHPHVDS